MGLKPVTIYSMCDIIIQFTLKNYMIDTIKC